MDKLGSQVQDPPNDEEENKGAGGDAAGDDLEEGQEEEAGAPDKGAEGEEGKAGEEHEPPAEHPRFKKVYGKMKALERDKEEMQKDLDALRNHSRQIMTKLEEIEKGKADRPAPVAPDPVQDPDGHKAWTAAQELEKQKDIDKKLQQTRIETLIEVESGLHDDYDDMVKIAERDMEKSPELKKQIFGSNNPARAAYRYAKKLQEEKAKVEKQESERQDRIKGSHVEPGGDAPPSGKQPDKIDDEEARVIRNLWPDLSFAEAKKKYLANRR